MADLRALFYLQKATSSGVEPEPDWDALGEGFAFIATDLESEPQRRSEMHRLWRDLANAWITPHDDEGLNWQLIELAGKYRWPTWVVETLPRLCGMIPGNNEQKWYFWSPIAWGPLQNIVVPLERPHEAVLVCRLKRKISPIIERLINEIDGHRAKFDFFSSALLPEIIVDVINGYDESGILIYSPEDAIAADTPFNLSSRVQGTASVIERIENKRLAA